MVAERIILNLWYRVVMASAQEVYMLRRQLEELNSMRGWMKCDRSSDRTRGSCENDGTDGIKTAPRAT